MHNNHQSAKRLEKVAETFTRLAEAYVRQFMQGTRPSWREGNLDKMSIPTISAARYTSMAHSSTDLSSSDFSTPFEPFSSTPFPLNDHTRFVSDDLDCDPMALLNFFSHFDPNISSTGSFMTGSTGPSVQSSDFDTSQQQPRCGSSYCVPQPLIRGLENVAQHYGLDASFDWFSWDQCDVSTT